VKNQHAESNLKALEFQSTKSGIIDLKELIGSKLLEQEKSTSNQEFYTE
jgi:hypothetical protein